MRELRLARLEKWLARAEVSQHPGASADEWLAQACGLEEPLPHAAIALAGEGAPAEGLWMHADPVHLHVQRDGLVLHPPALLELTRPEAEVLVAALQDLFRDDGLRFALHAPDRWYVRVPQGEVPLTTPLERALGADIFGLLPQGQGRLNWRSALTEAQMLLSAQEVNSHRAARGQPEANSVWFWGPGQSPGTLRSPFERFFAASAFASGVAHLAGKPVATVPQAPGAVKTADRSPTLVVLDTLGPPYYRRDLGAWRAAAEALDELWLGAMPELLSAFGSVRIVLTGPEGSLDARVSSGARWKLFAGRRRFNG